MKTLFKIIFPVLCVFILFCKCSIHKSTESNMIVRVNIIERLPDDKFEELGLKGFFYSLHIDLINNTDSIIRFWSMTCTWESNWIFNSDTLRFFNWGCDSNVPEIIEIIPEQKITFKGIVHVLDTLESLKRHDFRIGFILVTESEVLKYMDFYRVLSKKFDERKDIIWSEPFKIDK